MNNDDLFRWIILAGLVTLMPVGLYHRLKAHVPGESLDRRQEGWLVLLALRPLGVAHALGVIVYVIHPAWMAWAQLPLPTWVRWLGVPLGVAGGLLIVWTMHTLGRNLTDTVIVRNNAFLVTNGPYRWVRHPFYVACLLGATASSLVTANWFVAVTGAIGLPLMLWLRTPIEERHLIERFGDDYRNYMRSTSRFWPRWR